MKNNKLLASNNLRCKGRELNTVDQATIIDCRFPEVVEHVDVKMTRDEIYYSGEPI